MHQQLQKTLNKAEKLRSLKELKMCVLLDTIGYKTAFCCNSPNVTKDTNKI